MVLHPWSTLRRVQGLDRLPDRRVSKHPIYGQPDSSDPLRASGRAHAIYKALGVYALEESRVELYENYREMDTDPMIAAVLDAFAEDAGQFDPEHKRVVWVESPNEDIQRIVTRTLDRLHIDQLAYPVMRSLARDGDVFMHAATAAGQGVVALRAYEPWTVSRIEDDIGRLLGFAPADEQGKPTNKDQRSVPFYQVLHFRLPPREMTDDYGASSSFLWGSRIIWRQLQLMFDQVVIQRLLRRPDRLLIMMDATGMSYEDAWGTVKEWERRFHREWHLNPGTGTFASHGLPLDGAKDMVLPRGPNNSTTIENFPATNTNDLLRDVEMFLKSLAAGIGFPLGFIGRGEEGYNPGQSLARQYQPFAKKAMRLQRAFLSELVRLCMIDLAFQNLDPYNAKNAFTLNMASVAPIVEIERAEVIQLRMDRMERALAFGQNAGLDLKVWTPFVLEKYGGMSADLISRVFRAEPAPAPAAPVANGNGNGAEPAAPSLERHDTAAVLKELSEVAGSFVPRMQEHPTATSVERIASRHLDMLAESKYHPAGLDEATGKGTGLSAALKLGGAPVSETVAFRATESASAEHRKRAVSRLNLVSALAGLPVPPDTEVGTWPSRR
jgi:hypothetical protein